MEKQTNYIPEIIITIGYVLLLCLVPFTFILLYYYTTPRNAVSETEFAFATSLPPLTPIPQLREGYTPGENTVFKEEFNNNDLNWNDLYPETVETEVKDGKFYITSKDSDSYALGTCSTTKCRVSDFSYFIQVELTTEKLYTDDYGIVFRMGYDRDHYFLFTVYPEQREYALYRHNTGSWIRRLGSSTEFLNQYPKSNILGIYVTESYLEFYINGQFIDSYYQDGAFFQRGGFGIYTESVNNNLIVDNLIIDKIEGQ